MFFSLKDLFEQYKTIIKNSFFLSIVYGIRLLLPFIAMPYIIRVCGAENYGKIILAQTVACYFSAFVNWGLPTILPKEIADNVHSVKKLSAITTAATLLKLLFALAGIFILLPLIYLIPAFQEIKIMILFAYIAVLAEVLSPLSIFQGLEKMQNITFINTISVIFYFMTLLIFVKNESQYTIVPLLHASGILLASITGLAVLILKYNIKIIKPQIPHFVYIFKNSSIFAVSFLANSINYNISRLLTGITLGGQDLATMDIAQKISEAASVPVSIAEQAIFPHNARKKDSAMARQLFWIMLLFSCICAVIMLLGTPIAVKFLGANKLNTAIPLTCVLSIKVVLVGLNYYTGAPLLVAFGYSKPYNASIIFSTVAILILSIVIYFMEMFSLLIFIFLMILGDLITFSIRFYYCKKLINIP